MLKQLIIILGLLPCATQASHIVRLQVEKQADVYHVYVEMNIDAPAERVREILTDYEGLQRLSRSITSSSIIDMVDENAVRVLTRFEKCVLFFCMNLHKVEDISEDSDGRIIVAMVPDASSFRSGLASWEVRTSGSGSRVIHQARLEPDIRLPSWMGNSIMKNTLRRELQESFENLECLSRRDCPVQPEVTPEQDKLREDELWDS